MTKERVRFSNCYLCGVRLTSQEAIRKPKDASGEELLWCKVCLKIEFPQKVKLIKRRIESWPKA
jgi:hypothetical protein